MFTRSWYVLHSIQDKYKAYSAVDDSLNLFTQSTAIILPLSMTVLTGVFDIPGLGKSSTITNARFYTEIGFTTSKSAEEVHKVIYNYFIKYPDKILPIAYFGDSISIFIHNSLDIDQILKEFKVEGILDEIKDYKKSI